MVSAKTKQRLTDPWINVAIVAAILGFLLVAVAVSWSQWPQPMRTWFAEFTTSSGFGGFAALVAAGVATVTSVQRRYQERSIEEARLTNERELAEAERMHQRWWDVFTRYTRHPGALAPGDFVTFLRDLQEIRPTDVEFIAVETELRVFRQRLEEKYRDLSEEGDNAGV